MPVSSPDPPLHRSYLYAPGSSLRLMRKALATQADAVILDLEDAVTPENKAAARQAVSALLDEVAEDPETTRPQIHVRINRDGDGYLEADLRAVARPGIAALRLPKAESAVALQAVDALLTGLEAERRNELAPIRVYPTIESALGALSVASLAAAPRVARFAIGTSDLLADIGARGDDDLATLHVRSQLVLHSRVAGIGPPVDSVFTDLDDLAGLRAQARRGRALGFHGKSVIHPRQLDVVHEVFTPSDDELAAAERIVAAAAAADGGAIAVDGALVDAAIVARARAVLDARRNP